MPHITYDMVRDDFPAIIERKGENFIYSPPADSAGTCQYVSQGKPSCLIGHYLIEKGVPASAFATINNLEVEDLFQGGYLDDYDVTADPEAIHAMGRLQHFQDHTHSWGGAYNAVFDTFE